MPEAATHASDEVYLNGSLVRSGEARVSVFDRGFLFGDGVYEVVRCFGGRWLDMESHRARLRRSLAAVSMSEALADELPRAARALTRGSAVDAAIYLQITRGGVAPRAHLPPAHLAPTVVAMLSPCESLSVLRESGCAPTQHAVVAEDRRWLNLEIKSVSLLGAILPLLDAARDGATEVLFVRDGFVAEGGSSNAFIVEGDTVITPPLGQPPMLRGCMRSRLLDVARAIGLAVHEAPVPLERLRQADAIFTTGSRSLMKRVDMLDGAAVGRARRTTGIETCDRVWCALLDSIDRDARWI